METTHRTNTPPPPPPNSYRAEDIIAEYGSLEKFMAARGPKAALKMPDLGFTEAENQRMDQLLAEEYAAANSL